MSSVTRKVVSISRSLSDAVDSLSFSEPVHTVYNPLVHARRSHEAYLRRYAQSGIEALLLGMNPGPWGMVQTGVPFGEVQLTREFLGIDEPVDVPVNEHPRRPVQGFACTRREVSGRRLWTWAEDRFKTPEAFFARFFVWNHCPLAFLEEGGRNRTPDKLPANERLPLLAPCDEALAKMVEVLQPRMVIGVGGYALKRAREVFGDDGPELASILHPSPASPAANRGWAPQIEKQFESMGITLP
ncbi:MAG: single-stranded DNA-binding protein [Phycisphaerales bacterium]|nr:single-stranded DNA-binding protein [Phycisphaerales bacterium]